MSDRSLDSLSDEALAELARGGCGAAVGVIVVRMAPVVKSIASKHRTAGEADDLAQEGMIGLLNAVGSFDPKNGAAFRTYATVCIGNRIISAVRKNIRGIEGKLVNISGADDADLLSGGGADDPQNIIVGQAEADRLMSALTESLSHFEGDVLRLYLSGEKYSSIASQLSSTYKSVDNAMQRIRKKLRSFQ
ncbi:MAG: sigma-70 family RNA polymerase sigma factor [Clostridiales bacterium]|nr:sigma-70 family RNA polymerase sigma factor [Clostridiales bacterium]